MTPTPYPLMIRFVNSRNPRSEINTFFDDYIVNGSYKVLSFALYALYKKMDTKLGNKR